MKTSMKDITLEEFFDFLYKGTILGELTQSLANEISDMLDILDIEHKIESEEIYAGFLIRRI